MTPPPLRFLKFRWSRSDSAPLSVSSESPNLHAPARYGCPVTTAPTLPPSPPLQVPLPASLHLRHRLFCAGNGWVRGPLFVRGWK